MKLQRLKPVLAIIIIGFTIGAFIWYVRANPAIIDQLAATNPWLVTGLLTLYGVCMLCLVLVQLATLRLSKLQIPARDNVLLTIYSTIINFFGPLQSGPTFRGAYLKRRFGVSIKRYTFATLGYYSCFAVWSGLFIATAFGWRWWLGGVIIAIVFLLLAWRVAERPIRSLTAGWQIKNLLLLFIATFLQLAVVALIYYFELHSLNQAISFHQALIYTGAANFALFVSITPGAIGFRESFVLFTQQLHHIPTDTVVSASLLDRATYVLLLAVLFVVTLVVHARQKLSAVTPPSRPTAD